MRHVVLKLDILESDEANRRGACRPLTSARRARLELSCFKDGASRRPRSACPRCAAGRFRSRTPSGAAAALPGWPLGFATSARRRVEALTKHRYLVEKQSAESGRQLEEFDLVFSTITPVVKIAALRTRDCTPRGGTTASTLPNPALLSDQGPGSARPNGVCPRFAAGRAAVWVSAPRRSGGRRLLN